MSIMDAARKTVRRLSDRVDRRDMGYTMQFNRQPDGSGFLDCYDAWQRMSGTEAEQRAKLFAMQDNCVRHNIITADEITAINLKYGVTL